MWLFEVWGISIVILIYGGCVRNRDKVGVFSVIDDVILGFVSYGWGVMRSID